MDFILLLFTNRYWMLQPKLSHLLVSKLLRSCGLKVRLAQWNWLFVCTQFSFKAAISCVTNTKARFFVSCHFRWMCCNIIWHRTLRLVSSSISKQEHNRFLPRYLLFIIHTVRIIRCTKRMQLKKQTISSGYKCEDWESKYEISIFALYFILLSTSM